MSKNTVVDFAGREENSDPLAEVLRQGGRELIQRAVAGKLGKIVAEIGERLPECGRATVVRYGYQLKGKTQTGIGSVKVQVPKARAKNGTLVAFRSGLVSPYVHRIDHWKHSCPGSI